MKRFVPRISITNIHAIRAIVVAILSLAAVTNCARGQLYGIEYDTGNLYRISTANAALSLVGNTRISNLGSLEYRPSNGLLYAIRNEFVVDHSVGSLYRINPANASVTLVGSLGPGQVGEGGLVIAPDGTAYATQMNFSDNPTLFKINLETAATTTVGTISGGIHDINGLAWRSDNMLVGLDRVTDSLLAINPSTAASSVIAVVSAPIGGVGGMAAVGDSGYFATGNFNGSNSLYSFNLNSGAHALIGSFSPTIAGVGIGSLAFVVPEPASVTLAALAIVPLLVRRRRPQVILVWLLALGCVESARAQEYYGFTKIAEGPSMIASALVNPVPAVINDAGQVAFFAVEDPNNIQFTKVQVGDGGPLTTIVAKKGFGDNLFDVLGNFTPSTQLSINSVGEVAFSGVYFQSSAEGPFIEGLYKGNGGAISTLLEQHGGGVPMLVGTINDAGDVAAYRNNHPFNQAFALEQIFVAQGHTIVPVVESTSNFSGPLTGSITNFNAQPAMNNFGTVAFSGRSGGVDGTSHIFVAAAGGARTALPFVVGGGVDINDSGRMAFVANLSGVGIFTSARETPKLVAGTNSFGTFPSCARCRFRS